MLVLLLARLRRGINGRRNKTPNSPGNYNTDHIDSTDNEPRSPMTAISLTDLESQGPDQKDTEAPTILTRYKPTSRMISDFTIGVADGMTVPFALTAGLSFVGSIHIVVLARLGELFAGTISMAIGGYLGARGEHESHNNRVANTKKLIRSKQGLQKLREVFRRYPGVSDTTMIALYKGLEDSPDGPLDFLMRNQHEVTESDAPKPWLTGVTIGLGYLIGGILPLIPYLCVQQDQLKLALYISIGIMAIALLAFGCTKTLIENCGTGGGGAKSTFIGGLEMLVIGGAAVGISILIIRGVNHEL